MSIDDKITEILEKNNLNPVLSGYPELLGIIRIYEEGKIDIILNELESFFNIIYFLFNCFFLAKPFCSPSFQEIRYKIII